MLPLASKSRAVDQNGNANYSAFFLLLHLNSFYAKVRSREVVTYGFGLLV